MKKKTVLIVDDHELVRKGLSTLISNHYNHQIDLAQVSSGYEAITLLKNNYDPDLILLDINMPELNGIETCKIITRDFPQVKIIMLSLNDENIHSLHAKGCAAVAFINKSEKKDKLLAAIDHIICKIPRKVLG